MAKRKRWEQEGIKLMEDVANQVLIEQINQGTPLGNRWKELFPHFGEPEPLDTEKTTTTVKPSKTMAKATKKPTATMNKSMKMTGKSTKK